MKTQKMLIYFLTCILICSGFVSLVEAQKKTKPNKQKPVVLEKPVEIAEVDTVSFDEKEVRLVCPFSDYCSKKEENVKVSVVVKNDKKKGLVYYYHVSGGKIIGQGANVIWDFSGMRPGEHSITVGVGKDFIITGKTVTKRILVKECDICDPPCNCLSFSILGPTMMPVRGDTLIFTAKIEDLKNVKFNWNITSGIIIAGQGTPQIMVKTSNDTSLESVSSTLEIQGYDFCADCQTEKTATVYFQKD
jgi:hypothetical protein